MPVCYEGEFAPDLAEVARLTGLTPDEVVALHSGTRFHVYMLGFLPGFPYMGDLPRQLALPRRADPRLRVPAGSISIATSLTAIYPYESPGGWHLIGATPIRLFDPERPRPGALRARRRRQFQPIDPASFASIRRAVENGGYEVESDADRRMTPGLKVLSPGLHTTVQDLGRIGYQEYRRPGFGRARRLRPAARQCAGRQSARGRRRSRSWSAGRPSRSPPTRRGSRSSGPEPVSRVARREPAGRAAGQSVTLPRGEILQIVVGRQSACCYLAVEGGIAVPLVLGSASTYVRAAIGGLDGRALQRGDFVPLAIAARPRADRAARCRRLPPRPVTSRSASILGPQQEYFTRGGGGRAARRRVPRLKGRRPHGYAPGWPAAAASRAAGTSFPTRSRPAPFRCPARDSRSSFSPITRRRADTPKLLR